MSKNKTIFAGNPNSSYDPGLIIKEVHDYYGQAIRTVDTRSVVDKFYTHFRVNYNANSLPIEVTYYRGTEAHSTQVGAFADVGGSLNNKYFFLYSAPEGKKYHVWFNVDALGVDPAPVGSTGIEIEIMSNDPAIVVSSAISLTLNSLYKDIFTANRNGSVVSILTSGFGITANSTDFNTGFVIANTVGAQETVRYLEIEYSGTDPIYKGEVLKNYRFNIFEGKFENSLTSTTIKDNDGDTLDINANGSINVVLGDAGVLNTRYAEVLGVVTGVTTLIDSFVTTTNILLTKVDFSGENIAEYELVVDGATVDKKRTSFGSSLNDGFNFLSGLPIPTGKLVELYVVHNRPSVSDFNSRIQTTEL
jgi:hypothetical protein